MGDFQRSVFINRMHIKKQSVYKVPISQYCQKNYFLPAVEEEDATKCGKRLDFQRFIPRKKSTYSSSSQQMARHSEMVYNFTDASPKILSRQKRIVNGAKGGTHIQAQIF